MDRVDYQTEPSRYKHWKLKFDGPVATLLADFDENAGLRPGYKLKLNSYDLGVDIELHDEINRIIASDQPWPARGLAATNSPFSQRPNPGVGHSGPISRRASAMVLCSSDHAAGGSS